MTELRYSTVIISRYEYLYFIIILFRFVVHFPHADLIVHFFFFFFFFQESINERSKTSKNCIWRRWQENEKENIFKS